MNRFPLYPLGHPLEQFLMGKNDRQQRRARDIEEQLDVILVRKFKTEKVASSLRGQETVLYGYFGDVVLGPEHIERQYWIVAYANYNQVYVEIGRV